MQIIAIHLDIFVITIIILTYFRFMCLLKLYLYYIVHRTTFVSRSKTKEDCV